VDVEVLDWFVPAVRDPLGTDLRRFGVELQVISPGAVRRSVAAPSACRRARPGLT
jgi:hypothetical protein